MQISISFSEQEGGCSIWRTEGKSIMLNVSPSDTIAIVKLKIQKTEGYPPNAQRLAFSGRNLKGGALRDYGIHNDCNLCLVVSVRPQFKDRKQVGLVCTFGNTFKAPPPMLNLREYGMATSFSAGGLPEGISIDLNTGTITGEAKFPGFYKYSITATNRAGSAQIRLTLSVQVAALRGTWAEGVSIVREWEDGTLGFKPSDGFTKPEERELMKKMSFWNPADGDLGLFVGKKLLDKLQKGTKKGDSTPRPYLLKLLLALELISKDLDCAKESLENYAAFLKAKSGAGAAIAAHPLVLLAFARISGVLSKDADDQGECIINHSSTQSNTTTTSLLSNQSYRALSASCVHEAIPEPCQAPSRC
jgi:hypothetical protein